MSTCEPLQGNADFYGLGIRIGIYLQWSSSWLSLLLDPESAQGVLDATSIFVFAVAIATMIAAAHDAPAIEMYIMLQILLGFHITTLSSFGIRIWLMSPSRLHHLRTQITQRWNEDRKKRHQAQTQEDQTQRQREEAERQRSEELMRRRLQRRMDRQIPAWLNLAWDWVGFPPLKSPGQTRQDWSLALPEPLNSLYALWNLPVQLPLRIVAPLKFPGLSWSGVVWRTTIIALVTGYNLAYWFDNGGHGVQEPPTPGCEPPVVFVFSKQLLEGAVVSLGRVAAVMAVVIVGPPALTLLMLTLRVSLYALLFLYRDVYFLLTSSPMRQSLQGALGRVNQVLRHKAVPVLQSLEAYSPLFSIATVNTALVTSVLDLFEFMTTNKADSIRFSDVIKVGVSLGLGKPVRHGSPQQGPRPLSRAETMLRGWRNKT